MLTDGRCFARYCINVGSTLPLSHPLPCMKIIPEFHFLPFPCVPSLQLFSLGDFLKPAYAVAFLAFLIVFTIFFEVISDQLEHRVKGFRTAELMVRKVYKEMSILGFVSFIALCITKSCVLHVREDLLLAFEAMHVMIFGIGVGFILLAGVTLFFTYKTTSHWDKVGYVCVCEEFIVVQDKAVARTIA